MVKKGIPRHQKITSKITSYQNNLFSKCMTNASSNVIKGSEILSYSQSSFAFYCNHFVDDSKKDSPRDDIISLAEKGIMHEDEIFHDEKQSILHELNVESEDQVSKEYMELIPTNFKQIQIPTMKEKFKMCLDEMINKKTKIIHDAPLFYLPANILGKPDTLERRKGKSIFGSHHYIIKEVKSAKIIQRHHILQAAFYNLLIGKIQQHVPKEFYIINGYKKETSYLWCDWELSLVATLKNIMKILQQKWKPSPFYNRTPYPWSEYGNKIAIKNGGITLINGIKEKREQILKDAGYKTINKIASCDVSKLANVPKIGNMAKQFKAQAQAIKQNKEIKKENPTLPKRKTEIFLDFEGEYGRKTIYLIGILVRENKKEKYVSFVSGTNEQKIWQDLAKFLRKQNDYVVYHWHTYEKTHIKRMGRKYKTPKKILDSILSDDKIIDLYKVATNSFAFPTYSNDLKSIAKYIGFRWNNSSLDGSNIGELFEEYLNNPRKNKQFLQMVLDYNKDDCEASMVIKDWLMNNR